jgi:transposase
MTHAPELEADIRRYFFAKHWKVGTIAAQLAIHPDVVRRVTGLDSARRVVPAQEPGTLVTPFTDFIEQTLARYPRLRATRLFDMLKPRGYTGSVRTLREHVARVRPASPRGAFLRLEVFVGEQAQVDWAFVGNREVPGGRPGLWLFVMVLS